MSLQDSLTVAETTTNSETIVDGAGVLRTPTNGHPAQSATQVVDSPVVFIAHKEPPLYRGTLEQFKKFDSTPNTGTEFPDANLAEWLRAPNSDDLIRDLAITGKFVIGERISFVGTQ